MDKRKSISQKIRFEVFKRDKFKCQYCGRFAPDVVLNIEHVIPVSKGGGNDILNLLTACQGCNGGKGARLLDDHAALTKTREQMAELEEKRAQLAMMAQWRQELISDKLGSIQGFVDIWKSLTNHSINTVGQSKLRRWASEFSFEEIADAMEKSVNIYVKSQSFEDINKAFLMIGGVAYRNRQEKTNPEIGRFYYVRGVLKNRFGSECVPCCIPLLSERHNAGVPTDFMESSAKTAHCWTCFTKQLAGYNA